MYYLIGSSYLLGIMSPNLEFSTQLDCSFVRYLSKSGGKLGQFPDTRLNFLHRTCARNPDNNVMFTYFKMIFPFCTPWKHQKKQRFSNFFKWYRNGKLTWNKMIWNLDQILNLIICLRMGTSRRSNNNLITAKYDFIFDFLVLTYIEHFLNVHVMLFYFHARFNVYGTLRAEFRLQKMLKGLILFYFLKS